MQDLATRGDVHDLVVGFYREIVFDEVLEPVFDEVAEVDWTVHLPKLVDYWCRVLLGMPGYEGALISPHRRVHDIESFRPEWFDRWYELHGNSVKTSVAAMAELMDGVEGADSAFARLERSIR